MGHIMKMSSVCTSSIGECVGSYGLLGVDLCGATLVVPVLSSSKYSNKNFENRITAHLHVSTTR